MTREERCELAIERGYTYNPETGKIRNRFGKETKSIRNGYIYMGIQVKAKTYNLSGHHFAWFWVHKECDIEQLDHINGIRTDNRISNLRKVTQNENQWNRVTAKGYSWKKRDNKWEARIIINRKNKYLGCFNSEEEARKAYLEAKEKYHII